MAAVRCKGAGPWRAADGARPLRWSDEGALRAFGASLQNLLSQWSAAWGMPRRDADVRCQPLRQQSLVAGDWLAFGAGGTAQAWLLGASTDDAGLRQSLFPDAARYGPLARAIAGSCRRDALERIAHLLGLACGEVGSAPPAVLGHFGSGAVEADLPAPLGARLVLGPHLAARCMTGRGNAAPRAQLGPLVEAAAALARHPLELSVELRGCEIDVGALQDLQVGDVVRLDHELHAPAAVRHAGAALCSAYMGCRGTRKAVELAGCAQRAGGEAAR